VKKLNEMTIKEAEDILSRIYRKEGQPILIITDAGGYRGGIKYSMTIGKGRIEIEGRSSLEELLKATQEYQ
jgi:hypothetical protein